jgi:hypothetical protein
MGFLGMHGRRVLGYCRWPLSTDSSCAAPDQLACIISGYLRQQSPRFACFVQVRSNIYRCEGRLLDLPEGRFIAVSFRGQSFL